MTVALIVLGVFFLLFILYTFVLIRPRMSVRYGFDKSLFTDYAHRGLHGNTIPENSLAAFRAAVEHGYGIELDVQLSKDGKVMVFHDAHLGRMTGCDRFLAELTADELRNLRLKDSEEQIPFFSEVLELVDGKVPLLIELKGETTDTSVCAPTAELLADYRGAYCIESFNPMLLRWVKKNLPGVMRGILVTNVVKDKKKKSPLNYALTGMLTNILHRPDFIAYNVEYDNLSVDITTKFFSAPAFAWTVRDEENYRSAREYGAHVIFERITPQKDDL